jgi:hypothetical protein
MPIKAQDGLTPDIRFGDEQALVDHEVQPALPTAGVHGRAPRNRSLPRQRRLR